MLLVVLVQSNCCAATTLGTSSTDGLLYLVNGAIRLLTLYRVLQNKDVAQILAQPRLVVKNGRRVVSWLAANFLSLR